MNIVAITLTATTLVLASNTADAQRMRLSELNSQAEQCYQQTVKLARGAKPGKLDTRSCTRVLESEPWQPAMSSAMHHNRALVLLAQGKLSAAREDLRTAVDLAQDVGMPHLALARLAIQKGDLELAISLFDQLLDSPLSSPAIAQQRDQLRQSLRMVSSNDS